MLGALSKKARLAVVASQSQEKVWSEVAQMNESNNVQPHSGAFIANYADAQAVARLEPYVKELHGLAEDAENVVGVNVVGVIVAINGEIQTMDVFESTPLFRRFLEVAVCRRRTKNKRRPD